MASTVRATARGGRARRPQTPALFAKRTAAFLAPLGFTAEATFDFAAALLKQDKWPAPEWERLADETIAEALAPFAPDMRSSLEQWIRDAEMGRYDGGDPGRGPVWFGELLSLPNLRKFAPASPALATLVAHLERRAIRAELVLIRYEAARQFQWMQRPDEPREQRRRPTKLDPDAYNKNWNAAMPAAQAARPKMAQGWTPAGRTYAEEVARDEPDAPPLDAYTAEVYAQRRLAVEKNRRYREPATRPGDEMSERSSDRPRWLLPSSDYLRSQRPTWEDWRDIMRWATRALVELHAGRDATYAVAHALLCHYRCAAKTVAYMAAVPVKQVEGARVGAAESLKKRRTLRRKLDSLEREDWKLAEDMNPALSERAKARVLHGREKQRARKARRRARSEVTIRKGLARTRRRTER